MPKNKRKPAATVGSLLEEGPQGDTFSAASRASKIMKNLVLTRRKDVVSSRLKEVMMKPNPIALKRREDLKKKKTEKKREHGNECSYNHPQHRPHDSYSNESVWSNESRSRDSYGESFTDDYETSRTETSFESNTYHKSSQEIRVSSKGPSKHGKDIEILSSDDLPKVYIVQQRYGIFALVFGIAQVLILVVMVIRCGGLAPVFNPMINPMLGPYPDVLCDWGAKNTYLIINGGEWWRLFSPIMLHAGLLHLLGNLGIQMEQGVLFEREWGSLHWVIIYIVSGAGGNLLSAIYLPNSLSVGSSGAVCGLFGAKLAEILCRTCEMTDTGQKKLAYRVRIDQLKEAICVVSMVAVFSFIPMVDWASHLGGFLGGLFIGFALFGPGCYYCAFAILFTLGGWIVTVFLFSYGIKYLYRQVEADEALSDVCEYFIEYGGVDDYQCVCQTWDSIFGGSNDGE